MGATRPRELDSWDNPPLFRWQHLRQLERVEAELASLRADLGRSSGRGCDRALTFVTKMQLMLPSLSRPRQGAGFAAAVREAAAKSREGAPEPQPEPQLEPGSALAAAGDLGRFRVHFHIMPGSWAMPCFGQPPAGFCWGVAIYPLLKRFQQQSERDLVERLPLNQVRVTVATSRPAARVGAAITLYLVITQVCFKPHCERRRFLAATTTDCPIIVLRTTDNPLRLPYRCIDGKHRIHRLLADGESHARCHVLGVDEVQEFVTALPLCALPPLSKGGIGSEEDLARACVTGALQYLRAEGFVGLQERH